MAWIKVDVNYFEHPKVLAAGVLAAYLNLRAIAYASRNLTDGFLSVVAVKTIAGSSMRRLVPLLVSAKLWDEVRGGWQIHDFLEHQQSRKDVETKRERAKSAAETRWNARPMREALPDAMRVASQPGMRQEITREAEEASSLEDQRKSSLVDRLDAAFKKLGCDDDLLRRRLLKDDAREVIVEKVEALAAKPEPSRGDPSSRITKYLAACEDTLEAERERVRAERFDTLPREERAAIAREKAERLGISKLTSAERTSLLAKEQVRLGTAEMAVPEGA